MPSNFLTYLINKKNYIKNITVLVSKGDLSSQQFNFQFNKFKIKKLVKCEKIFRWETNIQKNQSHNFKIIY